MQGLVVLACLVAVAAAVQQPLHPLRAKEIEETNRKTSLWKAGPTERFAHRAPGAAKELCGVRPTNRNTTLRLVEAGHVYMMPKITAEEAAALPDSFDSEENWPHCAETIGDIRDQSACGCCWAFAGAEAASDRLCIATQGKNQVPLSAQDLCFCASPAGCDGGELAPAWQFVKEQGLVTGSQFNGTGPFGAGYCSDFTLPHCHHHGPQGNDPYPPENSPGCPSVSRSPSCPRQCDGAAKAPHNNFNSDKYSFKGRVVTFPSDADTIAKAIMENGPVEVAFSVYSDFENYVSGVYHHTGGQMLGGHAVKMVGWGVDNGVKYWKIANSWNPYWGEKGYFRIVRGQDECGIESDVVASDGSSTWGPKSEL